MESNQILLFTFLEKYADIERENRILLDKMSNIMQDNKPKLYNPSKDFQTDFFRKIRSAKSKSRCEEKEFTENNC